ncbi:MAG: alpha-glucuronidase family glycosyl hydrolase [Gemmatimonadaceae bacterium]
MREDGYELWLRYRPVSDTARLAEYRGAITHVVVRAESPTLGAAAEELRAGLSAMLGREIPVTREIERDGALQLLVSGGGASSALGDEGFAVRRTAGGRPRLSVVANTPRGVLYGAFHLLRELQMARPLAALDTVSVPRVKLRILDHWDNLDRTVERGYAGRSIWEWDVLPDSVSPRYRDYARANASVGINGAVLTNVNANARVLTSEYLRKVKAIADVLRPYGVRVYLTARFNAPVELGALKTADPLDPAVRAWWKSKADEVYRLVPDFGGFVVKANSEGQPGPREYGRSHADGANMLADAVARHGGVVMWRAFVYSNDVPEDRVKQAYDEFVPLDGTFQANVIVQVKYGPLDFQPREPFHPLFGAMPRTPLALELQITKEYLGQDTHLAYLGPLWEEVLRADTQARGPGSTVARVVDGSLEGHRVSAIAGVANVGDDRDWTGSQFNAANWYAFGRLAWDPSLSADAVAEEWTRATWGNDPAAVRTVDRMMRVSREAVVNYMTPLGLAHLFAEGHHYGPGAWQTLARADWSPTYYHRADTLGLGFDRTASGSDAVAQYAPAVGRRFASRDSVPDDLLLWFHHVGWGERLRSGRTLWEELVRHYDAGVDTVGAMRREWAGVRGAVDAGRWLSVDADLAIQEREARWWRDASLLYFQQFSRMPWPAGSPRPAHTLDYYMKLKCPATPAKPRCPDI